VHQNRPHPAVYNGANIINEVVMSTKENEHTANLRKARERLVEDRRQIAADLAKPFKRGDEQKRELFTGIQSAIDAIDQAIDDERTGLSLTS
jgi:hypothetical protein